VEGCGYISSSYHEDKSKQHFERHHPNLHGVVDWREFVDSRVDHYQKELERQDRLCFGGGGDW